MRISDDRTPGGSNLGCQLFGRHRRRPRAVGGYAEVIDDDRRAAPRQEPRVLTSDAASCTGDHRYTAIKSKLVHRHTVPSISTLSALTASPTASCDMVS